MFGIKTITRKYRETKEGLRNWKDTRKEFGKGLWGTFKGFMEKSKGRQIIREEIPFEQAMASWGLGRGEAAARKGKKAIMFITIFFYAIFLWCLFYMFRSLFVNVNFISTVTCLLGGFVGLVVGTINLWRWMVIDRKRYVPFLKWLGNFGKFDSDKPGMIGHK